MSYESWEEDPGPAPFRLIPQDSLPARRRRKTPPPKPRRWPWWLALAAFVAVLGWTGWHLWGGQLEGRGRRPELGREQRAEAGRDIILRAVRELGVASSRVSRGRGEDGLPLFRFRCPERLHPVTANRWLDRIFREEGLSLLDCREEGRPGRPTLHFLVEAAGDPPLRWRLRMDPPLGEPPVEDAQPLLALIIDDFGYSYGPVVRRLLDLDMPLTVSILPGMRRSERIEREARKRGHAIFLHLPMEPVDYPHHDPGPGALFTGMARDSVLELLDRHAAGFRGLDGLNNHMGSRACRDRELMGTLLDWAAERQLIVVDSWTHPRSVLAEMIEERGLPGMAPDEFLDGTEEDEAGVTENLLGLMEIARQRGWALGIGHPREETINVLETMVPRLQDHDFKVVTVPELLDRLEAEKARQGGPR